MPIEEMLRFNSQKVEKALEGFLPRRDCLQADLIEAMRYSLLGGGKRIRPALALEFCKVCGGREEDVMPFACAVEMVHSYSLIHDDLPCMDDDDMRRGKPSTHKQFGEALALLAGDALLSLAFETLLKSPAEPARVLLAAKELAAASGYLGMVGGQVIDLDSEDKQIDYETLKAMHAAKTGAMILAAARMGCYACGAKEESLAACTAYAKNIGMAFQVTDDILDVVSDAATLGKSTGKDSRDKKSTYVTLYGLEEAKRMAGAFTKEAVDALAPFGERADSLRELAFYLAGRKN